MNGTITDSDSDYLKLINILNTRSDTELAFSFIVKTSITYYTCSYLLK